VPKGFGKTQPSTQAKGKARHKVKSYGLCHFGRDGVVRVLEVPAKSDKEAVKKCNAFLDILDLYLLGASDEELLNFVEQNPIDGGQP
jgi:hypothetical protein